MEKGGEEMGGAGKGEALRHFSFYNLTTGCDVHSAWEAPGFLM